MISTIDEEDPKPSSSSSSSFSTTTPSSTDLSLGIQTAVLRALFSVPGHIGWGTLVGVNIAYYHKNNNNSKEEGRRTRSTTW